MEDSRKNPHFSLVGSTDDADYGRRRKQRRRRKGKRRRRSGIGGYEM